MADTGRLSADDRRETAAALGGEGRLRCVVCVPPHLCASFHGYWLHRVEHLQRMCPRAAARVVRCRFRNNICHVAPRLSTLHEHTACIIRARTSAMPHPCMLTSLMRGTADVCNVAWGASVKPDFKRRALKAHPSPVLNSKLPCDIVHWTKHQVAIIFLIKRYVLIRLCCKMLHFSSFVDYGAVCLPCVETRDCCSPCEVAKCFRSGCVSTDHIDLMFCEKVGENGFEAHQASSRFSA